MKNEEQYKNQLEFLKQALKFYADKNNYKDIEFVHIISPIEADDFGSQARFALEQLKKIENLNDKMSGDYDELINNVDNSEESVKIVMESINKIKNLQ